MSAIYKVNLLYIQCNNYSMVQVSKACMSLCMWVHAMYKFYHVNKAVAPKKAALKAASDELAAVQGLCSLLYTHAKVN